MIFYTAILETVDPAKDAEILETHKAYLQKMIDQGNVFAKGPFTDHTGGLVIYRASSMEEAFELASADPAVIQGARKMTLKEWRSNLT